MIVTPLGENVFANVTIPSSCCLKQNTEQDFENASKSCIEDG